MPRHLKKQSKPATPQKRPPAARGTSRPLGSPGRNPEPDIIMAGPNQDSEEWNGPLTKRDIGTLNKSILSMKEDFSGLLRAEMTTLREEIRSDLGLLRTDITAMEVRVGAIEDSRTAEAAQMLSAQTSIRQLEHTVDFLELKCEDLENRSRRYNIRLKNMAEGLEGEDLEGCLKDFIRTLGCEDVAANIQFDLVHRVWTPGPRSVERPRDILLKPHNFQHRELILRAARAQQEWEFRGSKIAIFQDVAPSTLARRRTLRPITEALRQKGIKYKWLHPFGLSFETQTIRTLAEGVAAMQATYQIEIAQEEPPLDPEAGREGRRGGRRGRMGEERRRRRASRDGGIN